MSLISDKIQKDKLKKLNINIKTKYIVGNNILERNSDDSYNDDYRNYECRSTDWLFEYYMYRNEWTLTKGTKSGVVNIVGYGGAVIDNADAVPNYKINFARKASYLKSDVKVLDNGNNGSKEKPYILTE